ncbi:hypothetical protein [Paenibacillus plantarum]|uniref:hypothetical protein n=1 Tax=Paenibacillus plantarum TaxID=2654975 RepID=UPI001FEC5743|nr:hypothetical protein [Paenibacillus plantarum]
MGKMKVSKRKEKLIGTVAGVTAIAAPLMMIPGQISHAQKDPTISNALTTIVVPLHGTKYIDLAALYNAEDFTIRLVEENGYASIEPTFGHDGIYEIKANEIGTSTFTIFATQYEADQITDTFKVVVVPTTEDPFEYNFDISKMTSEMITDLDGATGILQNISPISTNSYDPVQYPSSNTPPYQYGEMEMIIQGRLGESISGSTLESQILDYFSDEDKDEYGEGHEELFVIFKNEDTPFLHISHHYESGNVVRSDFTPTTIGSFTLDVTITDHHGGFTNAKIPFEIHAPIPAPQIKSNSVVANHFRTVDISPIMYLSNDAEIDLNEIFYSEEDLDYSISVEYGLYTPHTATLTLENDGTTLTWTKLNTLLNQKVNTQDSVKNIKRITATTSDKETELMVNIQHTTVDPFPASIDMYQTNAAGTSSYILNFKSDKGFNSNKIVIHETDIQNKAANSVTAYVYQNDYLKFDFANGTSPNNSKVKIYAHDSNPNNLYLDDFNFKLVSPALTPLANSNIPTVHIKRLYPEVSDTYWESRASELGSFITSERIQDVFLEYWKDQVTQVVTVTGVFRYEARQGSGVLLNIDPFNGTKVFQVPFIKP